MNKTSLYIAHWIIIAAIWCFWLFKDETHIEFLICLLITWVGIAICNTIEKKKG